VSGTLLTSRLNGTLDLLGVRSLLDPSLFSRFFTPILDRANIALNLQGVHFLGGWMSAWILILMHTLRVQSPTASTNGTLGLPAVTLLGVLMELAGVSNVMPVWAGLSIHKTHAQSHALTALAPADVAALPGALAIGVLVPTVLMRFLPSKNAPSLFLSQPTWIYIRLFHPVLTAVALRLLKTIRSGAQDATLASAHTRRLYGIAFWVGAGPHILTMAVVAAGYIAPQVFGARAAASLVPRRIWPFAWPWPAEITKAQSIQAGVGMFLVWDELIASLTILSWAIIVHQRSTDIVHRSSLLWVLTKTALRTVLFGPSAAAVQLIQSAQTA